MKKIQWLPIPHLLTQVSPLSAEGVSTQLICTFTPEPELFISPQMGNNLTI